MRLIKCRNCGGTGIMGTARNAWYKAKCTVCRGFGKVAS